MIEEKMAEQQALRLEELRRKYRGYHPWGFAKVRGTGTMYEFTSWPWEQGGRVFIRARVLNDSTTDRLFEARKEIALVGWGHMRQRMYREGWKAGQAYMRFVQEEWRKEREAK